MTNHSTIKDCECMCEGKTMKVPKPCTRSAKALMFKKKSGDFKYACGSHKTVLHRKGYKVNHFIYGKTA